MGNCHYLLPTYRISSIIFKFLNSTFFVRATYHHFKSYYSTSKLENATTGRFIPGYSKLFGTREFARSPGVTIPLIITLIDNFESLFWPIFCNVPNFNLFHINTARCVPAYLGRRICLSGEVSDRFNDKLLTNYRPPQTRLLINRRKTRG